MASYSSLNNEKLLGLILADLFQVIIAADSLLPGEGQAAYLSWPPD